MQYMKTGVSVVVLVYDVSPLRLALVKDSGWGERVLERPSARESTGPSCNARQETSLVSLYQLHFLPTAKHSSFLRILPI